MVDERVAIIIPNGGMPEVAQVLCDHIQRNTKSEYDLISVNNPSNGSWYFCKYILNFPVPLGMTKAILEGMKYADIIDKPFAYWICTTSIEFPTEEDYLTPMLEYMVSHPDVVMMSPATNDMAWDCMKQVPNGADFRNVWGIDNVCILIRKDWFDSVGRYDPDLYLGWGTTLETCWKARRDNKKIVVMNKMLIKWYDGIAHKMDRRQGISREMHNQLAADEMATVLYRKYGEDWHHKMTHEFLENV
jgi:hypothetical protein